jgi:hypothetical protein
MHSGEQDHIFEMKVAAFATDCEVDTVQRDRFVSHLL